MAKSGSRVSANAEARTEAHESVPKKGSTKEITFEEQVKKLEDIVEKLESGDLPLEEALRLYGEGAVLSSSCSQKLKEAEQKIRQITENKT